MSMPSPCPDHPDEAFALFVRALSSAPSPEDFAHVIRTFFHTHMEMSVWVGMASPSREGLFCFSGTGTPDSVLPAPAGPLPQALVRTLLSGGLVSAPEDFRPATHLISIGTQTALLAVLALADPGGLRMSREGKCIRSLAALAALAFRHLCIQRDLENRKRELEHKIFERDLLEETAAALVPELDAASIGKKILLSVSGYLTCTSAAIYLRNKEYREIFYRVAVTGSPETDLPESLTLPTDLKPVPWPRHVTKGGGDGDVFALLLGLLRMHTLFPIADGENLTGFMVFGARARGRAPDAAELGLAAAMIQQARAPLRNAAFFTDLKDNQAALERSLVSLKNEIEERQKTEERLLEYQGIVAASQDPVALIDSGLRFVMVNRACAAAFGQDPEILAGKPVAQMTEPEFFVRKLKNPLMRCLAGETVRFRFSWSFPQWGARHIDAAGYPYKGRSGKSQAIFIFRDITQMQDLENRLMQSQKMEAIGTLAGGIAHDFNNILSGIMGYAELALSRLEEAHEARGFMEKAIHACTRASDLVRQILAFSRGDGGNRDMRPLCMVEITEDALKLLRASLPATLEIEFSHPPSPLPIFGNPTQIHQVLMNLCTNAAQAMDNRGLISIGLRSLYVDAAFAASDPSFRRGNYVELEVTDAGTGIPEEYLTRIFDPFFTTKPQGKGTGMGLSITHGIVGRHGGVIQVDSKPGRGSTFRIYIPMASASADEVSDPPDAPSLRGTERLLLVDDETELLGVATEMLSGLGYAVTATSGPEEALELFIRNPRNFDLALLDQVMPRMTGVSLAQHLLAIRPDFPVLLCSGFSEAVPPVILESMGIQAYLMKPFTQNQLAAAVRRLLD